MRRLFSVGVTMLLYLSMPESALLEVKNVPSVYPTIQSAIDASNNGDTVLVAAGTYSEKLNFNGKAITVISSAGAVETIIDASTVMKSEGQRVAYDSVVTFQNGEGSDSVLEGFTLQGGSGYGGGNWYGGGIVCLSSSSPTIKYNIIRNNAVPWGHGGGIGIMSNCNPLVAGNIIINNVITSGDQNCGGAGLYINWAGPVLINNLIASNSGNGSGGGIHLNSSNAVLINNTICDNSISYYGGGIYCRGSSAVNADFSNGIIWSNGASTGGNIHVAAVSQLTVSYSDVESGAGSIHVNSGSDLNWLEGNIDGDPMFVTGNLGGYYLSQIQAGQALTSPCTDAGGSPACDVCFGEPGHTICLNFFTTRTDDVPDSDIVDMGFHYQTQLIPTQTPPPTPTVVPTETPTSTQTFSPTETPTFSPTVTYSPTDTPTMTHSTTPTLTSTASSTLTPTSTDTKTQTPTQSPSLTPTITPTLSPTLIPTETQTPTGSPTASQTFTPAETMTPTNTPIPPPIPILNPGSMWFKLLLLMFTASILYSRKHHRCPDNRSPRSM